MPKSPEHTEVGTALPQVPDLALRVWAFLGGALLALATAAFLTFADPTRGRVFPLSWLGDAYDLLNIGGTLAIAVAVVLVAQALGSRGVLVFGVLTAVALVGSAIAAALRLAQVLVLFYPFVTGFPGFVALFAWGWVASGAAVRMGRLSRGMLAVARVTAIAALVGIVAPLAGLWFEAGAVQEVLFAASSLLSVAAAMLPGWWIALPFRWRSPIALGMPQNP